MKHESNENVREYLGRLKVAAKSCEIFVEHTCDCPETAVIYYEDETVKTQLIMTLFNEDIQEKAMCSSDKMDLDKLVEFVETLEKAHATRKELDVGTVNSVKTEYSRGKLKNRLETKHESGKNSGTIERCRCCGSDSHNSNFEVRKEKCPAFNVKCNNCGK